MSSSVRADAIRWNRKVGALRTAVKLFGQPRELQGLAEGLSTLRHEVIRMLVSHTEPNCALVSPCATPRRAFPYLGHSSTQCFLHAAHHPSTCLPPGVERMPGGRQLSTWNGVVLIQQKRPRDFRYDESPWHQPNQIRPSSGCAITTRAVPSSAFTEMSLVKMCISSEMRSPPKNSSSQHNLSRTERA